MTTTSETPSVQLTISVHGEPACELARLPASVLQAVTAWTLERAATEANDARRWDRLLEIVGPLAAALLSKPGQP